MDKSKFRGITLQLSSNALEKYQRYAEKYHLDRLRDVITSIR